MGVNLLYFIYIGNSIMAEGGGFEPPKGIAPFNDLANRRLQPLSHPSAGLLYVLSCLVHAECILVLRKCDKYFKF